MFRIFEPNDMLFPGAAVSALHLNSSQSWVDLGDVHPLIWWLIAVPMIAIIFLTIIVMNESLSSMNTDDH